MQRRLLPCSAAAFPALLLALFWATPTRADPHLIVEIPRTEAAIRIDADLDDWDGAGWIGLSPDAPHVSTGWSSRLRDDGTEPEGTPLTAADLSGSFALRWDESHLYLAARITDNVHDTTDEDPSRWYCRDAISLFLDVPFDGDGPGWIAGDHAFCFIASPNPPRQHWWRHGEPEGHREMPLPDAIPIAVTLTARGYDLEAAIPMDLLTDLTPQWQPPFSHHTAGFALLVTDPDGGANPFGGQLFYGGESDDDARWAQLRFSSSDRVSPPYIEIPPEKLAFEARLRADQQLLRPFFSGAVDSTHLQPRLAAEYFQTYLDERPSRTATRSLAMAFTIWGNAASIDPIRRALPQISGEEDVWDSVTPGLRQAFYLADQWEEGMALLEEREPGIVPLKSRSAVLYTLGAYWHSHGEPARSSRAFAQIARWNASPWHTAQALDQLRKMEEGLDIPPD